MVIIESEIKLVKLNQPSQNIKNNGNKKKNTKQNKKNRVFVEQESEQMKDNISQLSEST